jgi:hypothetical protein
MSDDIDKINECEYRILELRIATREVDTININNESGICLCCGSNVEYVHINGDDILPRWCSDECRDVWDRYQ